METMRVKLLQAWKEFGTGDVVEVDEAQGKSLIDLGMAEEYDEAAETAAKTQSKALDESIQKAVSDEIAKAFDGMKDELKAGSVRCRVEVVKDEADKGFSSIGEQLLAIKTAEKASLEHWDDRLKAIAAKAPTGYNEGRGEDGGFLVQQDFNSQLQERAVDSGQLASRVDMQNVSGNGLVWNDLQDYTRTAGSRPVSVYWTAEAGEIVKSKAKIQRREMRLEKLAGLYYATEELLEDDVALTGRVNSWFGREFAFTLDNVIFEGDGAGKPKGITNSDALVTVAKETGQSAATVVAANITKMYARMPAMLQDGAVWICNQTVFPQLPLMTIGDQPVWLPPTGLAGAPNGLLLGKPIIFTEQCETLGTKNDIMYVNLGEYLMISKGGIKAASSIHVRFIYDEQAFRFTMRTNGQSAWKSAMTPAKGDTLSPFVTLAARA
jgi:HK97 family phage major capsid protein